MSEPNAGLEVFRIVAAFLQALIWPVLIIFLVGSLKEPISKLVDRSNQASVEVPGFKLSLSAVAASAAAAGVALGKQAPAQSEEKTAEAVATIARAFTPTPPGQRQLSEGRVLWVDDNPENNRSLVSAFRQLGMTVVEARSTTEAERVLSGQSFDIVITDMGRAPDDTAGLTLIRRLKEMKVPAPVVIYAAGWASAHLGREAEYGVLRITNDPSVVYETVLALVRKA